MNGSWNIQGRKRSSENVYFPTALHSFIYIRWRGFLNPVMFAFGKIRRKTELLGCLYPIVVEFVLQTLLIRYHHQIR